MLKLNMYFVLCEIFLQLSKNIGQYTSGTLQPIQKLKQAPENMLTIFNNSILYIMDKYSTYIFQNNFPNAKILC